jgi:para-aminobenzoate synthetase component 1
MEPRLSRDEYISQVEQIRWHIQKGDCYEVNYCQEFIAHARIDPAETFRKLCSLSPNPFTTFYRFRNDYLICASPERFLKRDGKKIFSQPIKGTAPRYADKEEDEAAAGKLQASLKERAENVMVVDLVRNDLSRVCKEGTVKVSELFGLYSFPQVHQLISTIEGELLDGVSFQSIMEACFPMGSMTGAPKKRVMEIIDSKEPGARGIFSGSVGYMDEEGNFDFNVVIRSLMYNSDKDLLSYQVGSGITFYSDPRQEWEECMVKAEAIKKVLEGPALL